MYTHLFQLFLSVITLGIVTLAFTTYIEDRREARAATLEEEAHAYARAMLQIEAMNGKFENSNAHDMARVYKAHYNDYQKSPQF